MVTYPSDWKITSIEKLGKCYSGLSGKSADDFGTGSSNYITFLNVLKNIKVDIDALEKVSILSGENQNAVKKGDLFFNTSSETPDEVGMCAALLSDLNNVYLNSFCFGYRLYDTSVLSPLFASYFFNSIYGRQLMSLYAQGSTRYNLSKSSFIKMEIPVPSIKEQQAITSVLSDFDEHIDNLTELIEKKKAIREGALDDLLSGRTRINGFDVEWIESTIEDSTKEIITGGTPSTKVDKYWGGSIPWLASTEIHQKIITRATKNITKIGLNNSSAKMAPKDSVLIALAGQGKTRGTAAFLAYPMALNQSLAALVAADETDSKFLYYLIENMYVELRELSSGDGGRGGLNKTLIKNINIRLPREIKEQQAIASVLTAMDEEIESLETEKEKMMQIKEGAMDDLLTGRVRLKV